MSKTIKVIITLAAVVGITLMLSPANAGQTPEVVFDVCPEAQVVKFEYPIVENCKIADQPCVTFEMTIKNISEKPYRFMARIVMPEEGQGVGGFIPRKGKKDKATGKKMPPVINPGDSATVKYPSRLFEMPKRIEVSIQAME